MFLNHIVGLISLNAVENVLWYIFRIWTNRPAQPSHSATLGQDDHTRRVVVPVKALAGSAADFLGGIPATRATPNERGKLL